MLTNSVSVNSRRPKLADVARIAGVSSATVSRVLNHPEIVRPDVQAKVRRAITELGYAPDAVARALSLGRSSTIGAVVPTLGIAIFADGTTALQSRLREHGYTLLIANSEYDPDKELEEIRVLLERGVEGLVLVGDSAGSAAMTLARQYGVPLITTYVSRSLFGVPAVGIDNAEAMYRMVEHLLHLGHSEFGIISDAATPHGSPARGHRQCLPQGQHSARSEAGGRSFLFGGERPDRAAQTDHRRTRHNGGHLHLGRPRHRRAGRKPGAGVSGAAGYFYHRLRRYRYRVPHRSAADHCQCPSGGNRPVGRRPSGFGGEWLDAPAHHETAHSDRHTWVHR
jgi:hypothetical protein